MTAILTAPAKPTTTKVMYALGSAALSTRTDVNNAATMCHTYTLPGYATVTLVVSRTGGRLVRANSTTPNGPIVKYTGTAREVAAAVLPLAQAARAALR